VNGDPSFTVGAIFRPTCQAAFGYCKRGEAAYDGVQRVSVLAHAVDVIGSENDALADGSYDCASIRQMRGSVA
jgi:hypothetical protein